MQRPLKLLAFTMAALSLTAAVLVTGCAPPEAALYDKIKKDYAEIYGGNADELTLRVYGNYNEAVTLKVFGPWDVAAVVSEVSVGEYIFEWETYRPIYIYYKDTFYDLENAYQNEFLSEADLCDLYVAYERNEYQEY